MPEPAGGRFRGNPGIPLRERLGPKTFLDLHTEDGKMHGGAERSEG